eukprot:3596217-Prymnesium_polylepis.2
MRCADASSMRMALVAEELSAHSDYVWSVHRGLLARRHEDRVGLCRLQHKSLGWASLACAVLSCARGGGGMCNGQWLTVLACCV